MKVNELDSFFFFYYYSSVFADFNVLYRCPAQAVVLFITH